MKSVATRRRQRPSVIPGDAAAAKALWLAGLDSGSQPPARSQLPGCRVRSLGTDNGPSRSQLLPTSVVVEPANLLASTGRSA
jgi:hypothetical protein